MQDVDCTASIAYNDSMATITVRGLPEEIHAALRVRAARNGRSMEAEAREILATTVMQEPQPMSVAELRGWAAEYYRGLPPAPLASDELIAERRREFQQEEAEYRNWQARRTQQGLE